ncbi:hypothetical protein [uncultured Olleya sp.]|uniref:hypothetical protein n=1 Tax=uncultured Olleya sp. TaxID=757243 RepID=UPI00259602A2|nr:hypothetical protein [uncultured Olleya sp.]
MSLIEKSNQELIEILDKRKKSFALNRKGIKNSAIDTIKIKTDTKLPNIDTFKEAQEKEIIKTTAVEKPEIVIESNIEEVVFVPKKEEVSENSKVEKEVEELSTVEDSEDKKAFDPTATGATKTYNARMKSGYFGRRRR